MHHLLSPDDIIARAKARGLTLAEMCKRAEISFSTFTRWRARQTQPTLDTYRRLLEVTEPAATTQDAA